MTSALLSSRKRGVAALAASTVLAIAGGVATASGAAAATDFQISGGPTDVLYPGTTGLLNLQLLNPNTQPLTLTDLNVTITAVQPLAGRTCGVENFAVQQATGLGQVLLVVNQLLPLSTLGLTPAQLPQVTMVENGQNQDGCQGATVVLGYTGTAIGDDGTVVPGGGTGGTGGEVDGAHNGNGDGDNGGEVEGEHGGLPGTGADSSTWWAGLIGLGLAAAGATTIRIVRREKGHRS